MIRPGVIFTVQIGIELVKSELADQVILSLMVLLKCSLHLLVNLTLAVGRDQVGDLLVSGDNLLLEKLEDLLGYAFESENFPLISAHSVLIVRG